MVLDKRSSIYNFNNGHGKLRKVTNTKLKSFTESLLKETLFNSTACIFSLVLKKSYLKLLKEVSKL